eukprot:augustus_masked-scaffold_4-processed-gene-10.48-mRNA-1 protein AED:1.00 eAED:1.00 QI:0/0/0/0/1/1/2/0/495
MFYSPRSLEEKVSVNKSAKDVHQISVKVTKQNGILLTYSCKNVSSTVLVTINGPRSATSALLAGVSYEEGLLNCAVRVSGNNEFLLQEKMFFSENKVGLSESKVEDVGKLEAYFEVSVIQAIKESVVLSKLPKTVVDINISILEYSELSLATAIVATSLALSINKFELHGLVSSVTSLEKEKQLTIALLASSKSKSGFMKKEKRERETAEGTRNRQGAKKKRLDSGVKDHRTQEYERTKRKEVEKHNDGQKKRPQSLGLRRVEEAFKKRIKLRNQVSMIDIVKVFLYSAQKYSADPSVEEVLGAVRREVSFLDGFEKVVSEKLGVKKELRLFLDLDLCLIKYFETENEVNEKYLQEAETSFGLGEARVLVRPGTRLLVDSAKALGIKLEVVTQNFFGAKIVEELARIKPKTFGDIPVTVVPHNEKKRLKNTFAGRTSNYIILDDNPRSWETSVQQDIYLIDAFRPESCHFGRSNRFALEKFLTEFLLPEYRKRSK